MQYCVWNMTLRNFPNLNLDAQVLQKALFTKESVDASLKKCNATHFPNLAESIDVSLKYFDK